MRSLPHSPLTAKRKPQVTMLLRSSSTPIMGSLPSTTTASYSSHSFHHDSPNHHLYQKALERTNSLSSTVECPEHVSFSSPSHHHNPSPTTAVHFSSGGATGGFRRSCSDGDLASVTDHTAEIRWGSSPTTIKLGAPLPRNYLESAPSLSVYGPLVNDPGEGEEDMEEERLVVEKENVLDRSVTIANGIGEDFFFSEKVQASGVGFDKGEDEVDGTALFLALGLGINANDPTAPFVNIDGDGIHSISGSSGGGGSEFHVLTDSDGDRSNLEVFYKKMAKENPSDALFLRNYAQFLYQVKHEFQKAEEYYSRAILAEPGDGETLSQYARLIWDLHHDHSRASSYFEQAVQASPQDSFVLASYANFLWETEDGGIGSFDETPMPVGAIA